MATAKMENSQKKQEGTGQWMDTHTHAAVIRIQQDTRLREYVRKNYRIDERRLALLESIFHKMGERENGELESEIYLYGSLIKAEDLIARQMFLWLQGMLAEENRMAEPEYDK